MTLDRWIRRFSPRLSDTLFGLLVEAPGVPPVSQQAVGQWRRRSCRLSEVHAARVIEITGGAVTQQELEPKP